MDELIGLAKTYTNDPHCPDAVAAAKERGLVPGSTGFLSAVIGFINQFPYVAPPEAYSDGSVPGRAKSAVVSAAELSKD